MRSRPKGGLGRGLGALIPTGPAAGTAVMPPGGLPRQPGDGPSADAVSGSPDRAAVRPGELSPVPGARFAEIPVREGHRIAHLVKDALLAGTPGLLDVAVHVEPAGP